MADKDDNVSFTDTAADTGAAGGAKPSGSAMMDLIGTLNKNASSESKGGKKKKGKGKSSGGKGKKGKTKKMRKADKFESQNFLLRIEGSIFCASLITVAIGLLLTLIFFFFLLIVTKGSAYHLTKEWF